MPEVAERPALVMAAYKISLFGNLSIISAPSSLFQKVAFWRPLTVRSQNFGRQNFFPLAMATKMVTAWSTDNTGWLVYIFNLVFLNF